MMPRLKGTRRYRPDSVGLAETNSKFKLLFLPNCSYRHPQFSNKLNNIFFNFYLYKTAFSFAEFKMLKVVEHQNYYSAITTNHNFVVYQLRVELSSCRKP